MKSIKLNLGVATVCICFVILLVYHLYHFSFTQNYRNVNFIVEHLSSSTKRNYETPMRHIPLSEFYKDISDKDQDFSIEFDESKQGRYLTTYVLYFIVFY